MMRIGLDSNFLVYLSGAAKSPDDLAKIDLSRSLLDQLVRRGTIVIATQALGELFNVLVRSGFGGAEARQFALRFANSYSITSADRSTMNAAFDLAVDHRLQLSDALILSSCTDAGCGIFVSEDLQNGFVVRGMTVVNPFVTPVHAALADLLA